MSSITQFPVPDDPKDIRDQFGSDCPIRVDLDEPPYIHLSAPPRTQAQAEIDGANAASLHLAKQQQRKERLIAIEAILEEVGHELFRDELLCSVLLTKLGPELPLDLSQKEKEMVTRYAYYVNDLLYTLVERYRMAESICGVVRHWLHDRGIYGELFTEQQLRECADRAAGQAQVSKNRTLDGSWAVDARTMAAAKLGFLRLTELP